MSVRIVLIVMLCVDVQTSPPVHVDVDFEIYTLRFILIIVSPLSSLRSPVCLCVIPVCVALFCMFWLLCSLKISSFLFCQFVLVVFFRLHMLRCSTLYY
ncbi:hypothetical protein BDV12DRAFT_164679, partial [Aspergillus spectabilis]